MACHAAGCHNYLQAEDIGMVESFATKLLSLIFIAVGVVAAQSAPSAPAQTAPRPAQSAKPPFDPNAPIQLMPAPSRKDMPAQSAPTRKGIPEIAKGANGAIVTIVMANNDKPSARGTGFLVSQDGVVVTNYHVIANGNIAIVKFSDGTALPVDGVLAADKVRDLAIIKIHGKNFRALTLGNSDRVQIGEEVVAIGNPLGLEQTVSNGILSGIRADKEAGGKFLQVTAPITHGSSGGPLFNMMGEVIGITTLGFEGAGNLNFAIPVNDAKSLLQNRARLQHLPNEPEPITAQTQSHDENAPAPESQWIAIRDATVWRSIDYSGDGYGEVVSLRAGDKVENVGSPDNGYRSVFVPKGGYHGYIEYNAVSNNEEVKKKVKHVITVIVLVVVKPRDSELSYQTLSILQTMWSSLKEDGFALEPAHADFDVTVTVARGGLGVDWAWNIEKRTSTGDLEEFKAGNQSSLADCARAVNTVLDDYRSSRPDLAQARP